MRKYIAFAAVFVAFSVPSIGQVKFMDHIQEEVQGQGTVSVLQDQRLTDIVNGDSSQDEKTTPVESANKRADDDIPGVRTGKKVKVRGYRIQVYWGGSQRTDHSKAVRAGNIITSVFPELQAYTSFESPHWRCRVGDFTTRQDAAEYLHKLREANLGSDAMIVRSEIFVYQ